MDLWLRNFDGALKSPSYLSKGSTWGKRVRFVWSILQKFLRSWRKISGILAKNFREGYWSTILDVQRNFLEDFFQKKNVFAIVFRLWKLKIWASWEYSLSSTEFYVSRGTFWGKIFLTENILSLFVFRVRLKTFPNFGGNLSAMSSNLLSIYRKKYLEERCFLSKNWSSYTSHKNFALWAKRTRALAKTYRRVCQNCILRARRIIWRKVFFFKNYTSLVIFRLRAKL